LIREYSLFWKYEIQHPSSSNIVCFLIVLTVREHWISNHLVVPEKSGIVTPSPCNLRVDICLAIITYYKDNQLVLINIRNRQSKIHLCLRIRRNREWCPWEESIFSTWDCCIESRSKTNRLPIWKENFYV